MHSSRMCTVRCSGRLGCGGVPRGVSAWGCTPPLVDRMTDTGENITFPQLLLWTVKTVGRKFKDSIDCFFKEIRRYTYHPLVPCLIFGNPMICMGVGHLLSEKQIRQ